MRPRTAAPSAALVLACALLPGVVSAQWRDSDASRKRTEATNLVKRGSDLEAVVLFEQTAELAPPPTVEDYLHWGFALQRMGRMDDAAEKFAAAVRVDPQDATALNNLGTILTRDPEKRAKGIALLEASVRLQPGNPAGVHNLGWGYLMEGRAAEAANLMQRSVAATDPSSQIYEKRKSDLEAALTKLERATATADMPNILMVVVDTLRPDHLGAWGYERDTSPNLDALASEGVRFEHAISQAPWTAASVASLLTGLYPSTHGLDGGIDWSPGKQTAGGTLPFAIQRTLSPAQETLAELLRRNGYTTAGFVSNTYVNSIFGFAQGFDVYDDSHRAYSKTRGRVKRRGDAVNRRVFQWLIGKPAEPFFLLVHYNDPHWPYDPPEPHGEAFVADYTGKLTPMRTDRILRQQGEQVRDVSKEDMQYIVGLYDGEIHYADAQLGRLLAKLGRSNLARPLLTVVTADHGEEFLEHGSVSHGFTLYEEQIRVPLIFHQPERLEPRVVSEQVELIDVLPTVLSLAGIAKAPEQLQGQSLVPLLEGGARKSDAHTFSEATYETLWRSVRADDGAKLIVREEGEPLLFDLSKDPAETRNVLGGDGAEADTAALERALSGFDEENRELREQLGALGGPSEVVLDAKVQEQLEALGYIQPGDGQAGGSR